MVLQIHPPRSSGVPEYPLRLPVAALGHIGELHVGVAGIYQGALHLDVVGEADEGLRLLAPRDVRQERLSQEGIELALTLFIGCLLYTSRCV